MKQLVTPQMSARLSALVNEFNAADHVPLYVRSEDKGDGPLELLLHGAVGDYWEFLDSGSFVEVLNSNRGREVLMRINSPGGSVFDGVAIHTALMNHDSTVTARIEGVAASAASFLTTAADKIEIAKAGSYMIHRAWGMVVGNTTAMTDMAGVLGKLDGQIADLYVERTGQKPDTIMDWMIGDEDGTWFNADEALAAGFVDAILPGSKGKSKDPEDSLLKHRQEVSNRLNRIAIDNRLQKIQLDSSRLTQ